MYKEDKDKNDKRFNIILIIIIILLLLIILLGALLFMNVSRGCSLLETSNNKAKNTSLKISRNQTQAQDPNLVVKGDDEYFELTGYGQLEINENSPYVNLINPSENSVYLAFDVIYNDKVLYSTDLIQPGSMEQFNIYSCLDAGEHTLIYSIDVYDVVDLTPLWTGIEQQQEIIIKK